MIQMETRNFFEATRVSFMRDIKTLIARQKYKAPTVLGNKDHIDRGRVNLIKERKSRDSALARVNAAIQLKNRRTTY